MTRAMTKFKESEGDEDGGGIQVWCRQADYDSKFDICRRTVAGDQTLVASHRLEVTRGVIQSPSTAAARPADTCQHEQSGVAVKYQP